MKTLIALFVVSILSGCAVYPAQPIAYRPVPVYRPAPVYMAPTPVYGPVVVDVHRSHRW